MDAEFGANPWLLQDLHQSDKVFMIDVASNVRIYPSNPHLWKSSQGPRASGRLRAHCKSVTSKQILMAHGKRRWRRVEIRDCTRGVMVAEYLHKKVWFWDGKDGTRAFRCHLIVRRTRNRDDSGWVYMYSLSNAAAKTKTKRLAYQQSQRFWIEQSIRDVKDGLGLDEYQNRKWKAWQHHGTMTMLAGLFVLKTRLENRDEWPLLSINEIRDILEFLLLRKVVALDQLLKLIVARHQARYATYIAERYRAGACSPENRDHGPPK